jgi:ABC-type branched-subunit amino acid transport system permease subunit
MTAMARRPHWRPFVASWVWGALLFAAAGLVVGYLCPSSYIFLASSGCILALSALGLTVVVGWAGEISLAQAGLTGVAVYVAGYAVRSDGWGWPFLPGLLVGVVVAVLLSTLVALPTSKVSGIYLMLLTLGLQICIERAVFSRTDLGGGQYFVRVNRPRPFGLSLESDRAFFFFCLAVLGIVLVLLARFRDSRHGRAVLLVRADRRAAAAMGISPWAYKVLAFAVAGALAGLAGGLSGPLFRTVPNLAQYISFQSLFYLAIPVLAGFESLCSVVVLAVTFTVLPQMLEHWRISPSVLGGAALMVGLLLGRRGVGGAVLDLLRARRIRETLEQHRDTTTLSA